MELNKDVVLEITVKLLRDGAVQVKTINTGEVPQGWVDLLSGGALTLANKLVFDTRLVDRKEVTAEDQAAKGQDEAETK